MQRYNTYQIDLQDLRNVLKECYPNLRYYIHILFIDDKKAESVLKMLKLDDNDSEVTRLKYWYG